MKKLILIAGLSAGLSAPAFATTNFVVDGDFSNPGYGGGWGYAQGPYWFNQADSAVESGDSNIYGLGCANKACQSMEVDYTTFGDVVQDVTGLTAGQKYTLDFLYGGRTSTGPQQMDVSFGGVQLGGTETAVSGKWTAYSFVITAASSFGILEFKALNTGIGPSLGNEVTNVSITGVPEVSTWAMMLAGFAGLGFVGYRRQKAGLAA